MTLTADKKDPMERTDPAEPTPPMDSTEPIEPTDKTEFREPMERNKIRDQRDHREPSSRPFPRAVLHPEDPMTEVSASPERRVMRHHGAAPPGLAWHPGISSSVAGCTLVMAQSEHQRPRFR